MGQAAYRPHHFLALAFPLSRKSLCNGCSLWWRIGGNLLAYEGIQYIAHLPILLLYIHDTIFTIIVQSEKALVVIGILH